VTNVTAGPGAGIRGARGGARAHDARWLALPVLASLAASRTSALLARGATPAAALTGGCHAAFLAAAIAAAAAALGAALLRAPAPQTTGEPAEVTGEPAPCTAFSVRDCRPAKQPG